MSEETEVTVYAIASGKGGVGKTTTTVNLGTALAQAGERVAIVDVDLGMANLAGFISLNADSNTLHDVLAGDASIEEATYELAEGIVAVPSGTDLDDYAKTSPEGLREIVEHLREEFDFVFLDVGAGVSHETVLPLGLADAVLLVSTPEPASIHDSSKTLELTDRAGGAVEGLLLTRTRPESDVSYEDVAAKVGVPLLGTIPDDPGVRDSVYAGTPLVVHDPKSPAAVAYRRLAAALAGLAPPEEEEADAADADADGAANDESDASDADADRTATHDDVSSAITEAESDP
ncbi:cell division ATPase MinD [Natrialbaceae archaeon GCM10025810]|uniref:cell division ATPase MinD n=1 Tax=Halovalidus salilacus TaxID=3075124 RepID=UPI00360D123F